MGDEQLALDNQVLNLNISDVSAANPMKLSNRNVISYIKEEDANQPIRPLYEIEAGIMVSLDGKNSYYSKLDPQLVASGAVCAPGITATSRWNITRYDKMGQIVNCAMPY